MLPVPPKRGNPRRVRIPSSSRGAHRPSRRTPSDLPQLSGRDSGNRPVRGRPEGCGPASRPRPPWTGAPGWPDCLGSDESGSVLALVLLALVVVWKHPQDASTPVAVTPFLAARPESAVSSAGREASSSSASKLPDLVSGQGVPRRGGGCGRKPGLEGSGIGDRRETDRDDVQAAWQTECTGSGCTARTQNCSGNLVCRRSKVRAGVRIPPSACRR